MKQVAGTLRLDLAQYRELAAFAAFGSDLDKATQQKLNRGARMVELLKQAQYKPMNVMQQVISLYAGTRGYMDEVPVASVRKFEDDLQEFMANAKPEILEGIKTKQALDDDLEGKLKAALEEFKKGFTA